MDGKPIREPSVLKDYEDIKLIIASVFWRDILTQLKTYQLRNICVYKKWQLEPQLSFKDMKGLDERIIDLGAFLYNRDNLECKELTFMHGGSGVLDYMFIREVAKLINCKVYLEIGTYIGESINILTDICEKLYSVTAEPDSEYSMGLMLCKKLNIPDYSERLASDEKIEHFYCDSKKFDFSEIREKVDLYFIDGDHSYAGVYNDTKKIFETRDKNSVVIWHDVKYNSEYNQPVVQAIRDVLGDEFGNVYVTNNNICAIYLPEQLKNHFTLIKKQYSKDLALYVYDTKLKMSVK